MSLSECLGTVCTLDMVICFYLAYSYPMPLSVAVSPKERMYRIQEKGQFPVTSSDYHLFTFRVRFMHKSPLDAMNQLLGSLLLKLSPWSAKGGDPFHWFSWSHLSHGSSPLRNISLYSHSTWLITGTGDTVSSRSIKTAKTLCYLSSFLSRTVSCWGRSVQLLLM